MGTRASFAMGGGGLLVSCRAGESSNFRNRGGVGDNAVSSSESRISSISPKRSWLFFGVLGNAFKDGLSFTDGFFGIGAEAVTRCGIAD